MTSPIEKLGRVQIGGFRSIRNLDLQMGDLTVLIGANGSGKSNFVSFFHMLNYMFSEGLQLYIGSKGGASSLLHYGAKQTRVLEAELEFVGEHATSEYGFRLAFASPDTLLFVDEYVRYRNSDRSTPFEKQLKAGQFESNLLQLAREPVRRDGVHNNGRTVARVFLDRLNEVQVYHFHDTSDRASIRTSQDIQRNRFLRSDGGNLFAFLYMLQEVRPTHYDRIISTIRLAVPYLKNFILEPDRLNNERILLRWHDKNPDYEFGTHQLSDGSLRAIALITALLQPEEMLPSVFLIDEPELGLHPSAVGLIGSLIKAVSAKRQVIVATQSPRLLTEFAPEDVVVVERKEERDGRGESTFTRLSEEDLGTWLEDYDLGALYEMNVTGGGPR